MALATEIAARCRLSRRATPTISRCSPPTTSPACGSPRRPHRRAAVPIRLIRGGHLHFVLTALGQVAFSDDVELADLAEAFRGVRERRTESGAMSRWPGDA
jgi:hypothetical protein